MICMEALLTTTNSVCILEQAGARKFTVIRPIFCVDDKNISEVCSFYLMQYITSPWSLQFS